MSIDFSKFFLENARRGSFLIIPLKNFRRNKFSNSGSESESWSSSMRMGSFGSFSLIGGDSLVGRSWEGNSTWSGISK